MKKPPDNLCIDCGKSVIGDSVRISSGFLHRECHKRMRQKIADQIATAIKDGRHTDSLRLHVCGQCRQWVDCIYFITQGRLHLCPECASTQGVIVACPIRRRMVLA